MDGVASRRPRAGHMTSLANPINERLNKEREREVFECLRQFSSELCLTFKVLLYKFKSHDLTINHKLQKAGGCSLE